MNKVFFQCFKLKKIKIKNFFGVFCLFVKVDGTFLALFQENLVIWFLHDFVKSILYFKAKCIN